MTGFKQEVRVSGEMLAFVGTGSVPVDGWPDDPVVLWFYGLDNGATPALGCDTTIDGAELADASLVLVIDEQACRRIFAITPGEPGRWHLPCELRALVYAIRDCAMPGLAGAALRRAKSVELLCNVLDGLRAGSLIALDGGGALTEMEAARIAAARRMVGEQWHEKLTLDSIARACGLNRGKLARGFRAMYDCSVADALTEQRLAGAQRLLQVTDLPVKAIGFRCGYLNNASFTRAFSRRFGIAPTRFRAGALAA